MAQKRYYAKVIVARGENGEPIYKRFTSTQSQYEAKKRAKQYLAALERERSSSTPFDEYVMHWLTTYKDGSVRPNTYRESYEKICTLHLIPYFRDRTMSQIFPEDIRSFFKSKANYSDSQKKKFKINLTQIFETAIDEGVIAKSPVRGIKIASDDNKKKEPRHWKESHYRAALTFAQDHPYGLGIQIMLTLGLRCSELLGLRWSDFDFFEKTVHIQRAATTSGGVVTVDKPKSENSDRYLPLPEGLVTRLKKEKSTRSDGYLFPMATNPRKPMSTPYYTKKRVNAFMRDLEEATGVPPINCHGLRHTFGTILWDKTADLLAVSKALGHSTLEITKSFYVHDDVKMLRKHLGPAMAELDQIDQNKKK